MDADIPQLLAEDRPHAPIIYFETAPVFGHMNGLAAITLCATLQLPKGNRAGVGVTAENVAVAYLRTNVAGARTLRDAIDSLLLAAQPTESTAQN